MTDQTNMSVPHSVNTVVATKDTPMQKTMLNKSSYKILALLIFTFFIVSGALLYISKVISQSPISNQSFAQMSTLQQSTTNTALSDLHGAKQKISISFFYNEKNDDLVFNKIEGARGYIFGEFAHSSSPDFDIIAYDNQSHPLFQTTVEVRDEYSDARDEGDFGMFQTGFSKYTTKNSPMHANLGTNPNTINKQPLSNSDLDLVKQDNASYFAELEYSDSINHIEIVPHEGSDKTATLLIESDTIDHRKIKQEIDSTKFNTYKSKQIQGLSSPNNIGILFVSDNYGDEEMNEFYSYVEYFRKELFENNVLKNYISRISIAAVQGKTGLEKRCSGLGPNCKTDKELKDLLNQYKSDVLVMVYKRTNEEVQNAQELSLPCRPTSIGNLISICDGFNGPLAVLT